MIGRMVNSYSRRRREKMQEQLKEKVVGEEKNVKLIEKCLSNPSEREQCKLCMTNAKSIIFGPCGHLAVC